MVIPAQKIGHLLVVLHDDRHTLMSVKLNEVSYMRQIYAEHTGSFHAEPYEPDDRIAGLNFSNQVQRTLQDGSLDSSLAHFGAMFLANSERDFYIYDANGVLAKPVALEPFEIIDFLRERGLEWSDWLRDFEHVDWNIVKTFSFFPADYRFVHVQLPISNHAPDSFKEEAL